MRRIISLLCLLIVCALLSGNAQSLNTSFLPVSEHGSTGALALAAAGQTAAIYYDAGDAPVVGTAVQALRDDVQRVTGLIPVVSTDPSAPTPGAVFVGTVGKSRLIDALVAQGKIDVTALRGKWEMYTAAVVSDPVPGVGQGLVIAGSDRRGTAFGVFALSEAIGVSPWYWWADVPTAAKSAVYVGPGTYTEPSPGVKYRGIFLNDEDWGLKPWASKTLDPQTGDIGPKTYEKVFELLLRLHANYCWPAMHECTKAFNRFPDNKVVADRYAIVMGSSHHEPMLRNTSEYDPKTLGPYNYWTNRQPIYDFWNRRVAENAPFESIYTIGMRGLTDDGIIAPPGTTIRDKAMEMQNHVIPDQRRMLAEHVNRDPAAVPQIFVPYKEALLQYQAGLELPDDVTLVWPDDNHGYIRELSTSKEQQRSGGSGVYYHLSYWGVPRDFLWLCTTPPGMTYEEMSKAWDYGARRLWIANVGDIKPGEIGMDFFLRLARNPEAFRNFSQQQYLTDWATRTFGPAHAAEIAQVLAEYYRLNIVVRPEHLNPVRSGFSFVANGDEAQRRLDSFATLEKDATRVFSTLPANQQDAFYQFVLYPARVSNQMNQKILLAERSRLYATQRRAATNRVAAAARAAQEAIQVETTRYNTAVAGGKWNGMMSAHPHPTKDDVFGLPELGRYDAPSAAGLCVAIEGSSTVLTPELPGVLPDCYLQTVEERFIDVFNTGTEPLAWQARASAPWIELSQSSGTSDARIWVGFNLLKVPRVGRASAVVTIQSGQTAYQINVRIFNPATPDSSNPEYAREDNGVVHFAAKDCLENGSNPTGVEWRRFEGSVPASGTGMAIFPTTAPSVAPGAAVPSLTYRFYTYSTGPTTIRTACLPTHHPNAEHPGVRYAIAINDEAPQVVNVDADEYTPAWNVNVLRASAHGISRHTITQPGWQTLRVSMVDAGVVLDDFTLQVGNRPGGEFEAEELKMTAKSGQAYRTFAEAAASAGSAVALESVNAGDFVTLAVPDMQAGVYELTVRVKELDNRGKIQVLVADAPDGKYQRIGEELDSYHASPLYADLRVGRVTLDAPGTKYLKFQVTGRNPANITGQSWFSLDRVALTPLAAK